MTIDQAMKLAQERANRQGVRMVVYLLPHFWRDKEEDYAVTKDRDDLPNEWAVVGIADPELER